MSIVLIQSPEISDLIHACLAGMKRNRSALRTYLTPEESRVAMIHSVIERLDPKEIDLLGEAHPETAERFVENLTRLSRESEAFKAGFVQRVLSGVRLNLVALMEDVKEHSATRDDDDRFNGTELQRALNVVRYENDTGRIIQTGASGQSVIWFRKGGVVHRRLIDGPALSIRSPAGRRHVDMYMTDGRLHRSSTTGPAVVEYDATGKPVLTGYFQHGLRHRNPKEGPAMAYALFKRGKKIGERHEYYVEGQLHRDPEDGPAVMELDAKDQCVASLYVVQGREYVLRDNGSIPGQRHRNGSRQSSRH